MYYLEVLTYVPDDVFNGPRVELTGLSVLIFLGIFFVLKYWNVE